MCEICGLTEHLRTFLENVLNSLDSVYYLCATGNSYSIIFKLLEVVKHQIPAVYAFALIKQNFDIYKGRICGSHSYFQP